MRTAGRKVILVVLCVVGLAILAAAIALRNIRGPGAEVFAGTTQITLIRDRGDNMRTVVISDKPAVARLVGLIELETKNPCACLHVNRAIFQTPSGIIDVSLCDHCFDFAGRTYHMPEAFYEAYSTYMKSPPTVPATSSAPASRPSSLFSGNGRTVDGY